MKKWIIFALAGFLVLSVIYIFNSRIGSETKKFKQEIQALQSVNDSLNGVLDQNADIINDIVERDEYLMDQLEEEKGKIKKVKVFVEKEVEVVKTFDSLGVVKFYKERYSNLFGDSDTMISMNKPVLVNAAEDLVRFDGAKEELVIKDSLIAIQDNRLYLKDSSIQVYKASEEAFKRLVDNKNIEIQKYSGKLDEVTAQLKKEKRKKKLTQVGSLVVVGGLTYLLLAK